MTISSSDRDILRSAREIKRGLSRERVEATPRRALTLMERGTVRARQFDLCSGCCAELSDGPIEFDHIVPLELGGSNDLGNIAALCVPCHKAKTRDDIARIRKAQRLERDASPETRRRTKNPIRSRGFTRADPLR